MFTNGPGHDVHIVLFQQSLEPVQLAAQPLLSIAIEKTADHHVRLSRATMPGTELQAAKANVIFHGAQVFLSTLWSGRSEEHTSELQSLMRTSYAVFCLKKKKQQSTHVYT